MLMIGVEVQAPNWSWSRPGPPQGQGRGPASLTYCYTRTRPGPGPFSTVKIVVWTRPPGTYDVIGIIFAALRDMSFVVRHSTLDNSSWLESSELSKTTPKGGSGGSRETWTSSFNLKFNSDRLHGMRHLCWVECALKKLLWHPSLNSA
jgi:hypothetical protein